MAAYRTRCTGLSSPRPRALVFTTAVFLLVNSVPASGGQIVLDDSGWKAAWADSLDLYVSIVVDSVTTEAVFIEKSAEFLQGPGPGGFPTIAITFTQVDSGAVGQIVINDEVITNSTGTDWTDFHFELLDSGNATFNPELTNASADGDGFSTAPFTNQMFSLDKLAFWVDGFGLGPGGSDAVIPNETQWFPGGGAFDGQLYIDVIPSEPFTVFTLKETPTIPEPATLGLLAFCAFILLPRRR